MKSFKLLFIILLILGFLLFQFGLLFIDYLEYTNKGSYATKKEAIEVVKLTFFDYINKHYYRIIIYTIILTPSFYFALKHIKNKHTL